MFELDLGEFGAPGFKYQERFDFSGHKSGKIDPHVNAEVYRVNEDFSQKVPFTRDLTNNQLPGFNGMQEKPF